MLAYRLIPVMGPDTRKLRCDTPESRITSNLAYTF
nr:MAG TPA: hypothetical protein [Caudoviricetes sp.]